MSSKLFFHCIIVCFADDLQHHDDVELMRSLFSGIFTPMTDVVDETMLFTLEVAGQKFQHLGNIT